MDKPKRKVEQIRYLSWDDTLAPGHDTYWEDLDSIARIITSELEAFRSLRLDDEKNDLVLGKGSSIIVTQYKEKFGEIRVYCDLAERSVLEREWKMYSNKHHENFEAFVRHSFLRDARHYRRTYLGLVRLFPHYENAILTGADYPQYLCKTEADFDKGCKHSSYWKKDAALIKKICDWPVAGEDWI